MGTTIKIREEQNNMLLLIFGGLRQDPERSRQQERKKTGKRKILAMDNVTLVILSPHIPTRFFLEFGCSKGKYFSFPKRDTIAQRKENEVAATTYVKDVSKSLRG